MNVETSIIFQNFIFEKEFNIAELLFFSFCGNKFSIIIMGVKLTDRVMTKQRTGRDCMDKFHR